MLERMEQLEKRVAELESKGNLAVASAAATGSTNVQPWPRQMEPIECLAGRKRRRFRCTAGHFGPNQVCQDGAVRGSRTSPG